ncbi:hypothetical protein CYFUS_005615 [Cystobacter fuscus]|uniref:Alpha-xenorhabdolysin family binary toxin subunit B n=1 Tax=Cystobacter fuscus TaxID=43 RepID=A0A250J9I4_9BACT|nr:hypothetical protein [Cystobacter fuscus]ATB40167.1 hypothetical protein CYFUS_005615 [Cystobacter fuscus]
MSADTSPPPALSPRLEELLHSLSDQAFAQRMREVYAAAGQAILRLSDLDLLKYETASVEDSPDLSLWEEMAPVIRDTVMDVNRLLNVIREQCAARSAASASGGNVPLQASVEARRARDATELLQGWMQQLAQGVTQLGEAMRNPAVVSDRWTLLAEIQRLRERFREQIGNLVFESASAFGPVTRQQVVPGHEAEVQASVMVRAIVADLSRIVAARLGRVREAEPEDVQWNAQQLQTELDAFGRTVAYRHLRAQDKRQIIELRGRVGRLAIQASLLKQELLSLVEELEGFVRSLSSVNKRQMLIAHDREVWAGCGVRLERAVGLLGTEPAAAARTVAEAAASAQSLYGRDPSLDAFLRKARKTQLAQLSVPELRTTIESLQSLLAGLDVL